MPDGQAYYPVFSLESAPTVWRFVQSRAFIRGIRGPLGSGKSVGCCLAIMQHASEQRVNRLGWRQSRWVVIRNTYPELKSTAIKTWTDCWPENYLGPVRFSHPITHHIKVPPRGFAWVDYEKGIFNGHAGLDLEVWFLALDRPADVRHLKSLEVTGAWVNEACEVPLEIIDMLTGRVGRYPSKDSGGASWAGIILDTNADDDQGWYFDSEVNGNFPDLEVETPEGETINIAWEFFAQDPAVLECEPDGTMYRVKEPGFEPVSVPPAQVMQAGGSYWAVNPQAENRPNLRPGYYKQQIHNKTRKWIERFLQAKFVFIAEGKPFVPEYSDLVMQRKLVYNPNLPLICGIDCGSGTLNPAATFGQRGTLGDHRVLAELSCFDLGLDRFTTLFHQLVAEKFPPGTKIERAWIDPAGKGRDEVYETAVEDHLKSRNIPAFIAPTNNINSRREALALPMGRLIPHPSGGEPIPGYMVDTECRMLRAGLAGKWYVRRVQVTGTERYIEKPEKNKWSHVCDAETYRLMGAGEYTKLTRGDQPEASQQAWQQAAMGQQPITMNAEFDIFQR